MLKAFNKLTNLLKFSYLCDIFEKLNKLNVSMKGNDASVLKLSDKIETFEEKFPCGFLTFPVILAMNTFLSSIAG